MFDYFFKLFANDLGIDLGTASVLVWCKGHGIVLNEPSVVAFDNETKSVLAIGSEAKKMLGRTPANIVAIRPLRDGVIADYESTQKMIKYFIQKANKSRKILHPKVVVGVPSGITDVQKDAVKRAAEQAGAREVYIIEEPMAAAIGAGIQTHEPEGNMIVDIGGGTTDVAVISLGGMVVCKAINVAGDKLDEAIVQYFKRKYNLYIGENTAERVKIEIGSVFPLEEELNMEVKGRDLVTGLPRTITVTSEEIRTALSEPVKSIVEIIKDTLAETPAELSADLVDRGIVLAGGGAKLRGLANLLKQETELPINIADDPLNCVVNGTGIYLEELEHIKDAQKRI
jgi:rod shape-determining protein MreB